MYSFKYSNIISYVSSGSNPKTSNQSCNQV